MHIGARLFLFYDWLFLHVCILRENLLFSLLILGLVFIDWVVFYMNILSGAITADFDWTL